MHDVQRVHLVQASRDLTNDHFCMVFRHSLLVIVADEVVETAPGHELCHEVVELLVLKCLVDIEQVGRASPLQHIHALDLLE